ncbi:MAG: DUF2400 family protein [Bacteroidales bacterium]
MSLPFKTHSSLKEFLDQKVAEYNTPCFIKNDPVSVPHLFTLKQDIEISAFLSATISWGNRKSIVANAMRIVSMMGDSPYQFLMEAKPVEFKPFLDFVHRTFNGDDCLFFLTSLQNIYRDHLSLEPLFHSMSEHGAAHGISRFREVFLSTDHLKRSEKHLANPYMGSAAKRINILIRII